MYSCKKIMIALLAILSMSAGATLAATRPVINGGLEPSQLRVNNLDAPLGLDGRYVPAVTPVLITDATAALQSHVRGGKVNTHVTTSVLAGGIDPAPGKVKTLTVTYLLDGTAATESFREGTALKLGRVNGALVIKKAEYGFVEERRPSRLRFSWTLTSAERGSEQQAYQILVASSRDKLLQHTGDLWDSGKIISAEQNGIVYAGTLFESKTQYWWQVKVWQDADHASNWSDPSSFETGILNPTKDWSGVFVGGEDLTGPCNLLRRSFSLPDGKTVARARAYVAGNTHTRGYYDFLVNGQRPSDRVTLRGGYFTFDVTQYLVAGENVIGAILPNGTADDKTPKTWLCDLDVWFTDGTHRTFGTDASCKGFRGGPVITATECDGEVYDARKEAAVAGWTAPGFDDRQWIPLSVVNTPQPSHGFQGGAVRLQKAIPVAAVTSPAPGVQIFDLGKNISGWARIAVSGRAGTVLTLRYAERIHEDGTLDRSSNLSGIPAQAIDQYTLKGGGQEIWEPFHTFHGFRYVEVTGLTLKRENLEGRWIHSDITRRSTAFTCSDPLLNDLFDGFRTGELDNSLYWHIDCNQRGERAPWSADAYACSAASMTLFDSADFWSHWIRLGNRQLGPHGEASYEIRTGGDGFQILWQSHCFLIPWDFHQAFGDRSLLEAGYERTRRFADCFINWWDTLDEVIAVDNGKTTKAVLSNVNHNDFLIEAKRPWKKQDGTAVENKLWYWGDWCHPNKDRATWPNPSALTSMYYFHCLNITAQEATLLGRDDEAAKYGGIAEKVRDAVNQRYLATNEYRFYGENDQTLNALALSIGIVPEACRSTVAASLAEDIRKRDNHLNTGVIGTLHLLRALTMTGQDEVALDLAQQTTFPSWGYMIKAPRAPGTFWEHWDNQDMSKNHPFLGGSLASYLVESVAGLRPLTPGYETIEFKPSIAVVKRLTHGATTVPTVRGAASIEWHRDGQDFSCDVTIPANSRGTLWLPLLSKKSLVVREGSTVIWRENFIAGPAGILSAHVDGDYLVVEISSGKYRFTEKGSVKEY